MNTGKTIFGEPIYFSVTVPEATVSNLAGAISFVTYLLSNDSQHILEAKRLNHIKPIAEGKLDRIPIPIRNMISMAAAA